MYGNAGSRRQLTHEAPLAVSTPHQPQRITYEVLIQRSVPSLVVSRTEPPEVAEVWQ